MLCAGDVYFYKAMCITMLTLSAQFIATFLPTLGVRHAVKIVALIVECCLMKTFEFLDMILQINIVGVAEDRHRALADSQISSR